MHTGNLILIQITSRMYHVWICLYWCRLICNHENRSTKCEEATCSYHWQRWIIRQSTFNESSNSSNIIKLSTQVSHYYEKIYLILSDPMSGDICADKNVHEMYFVYISSCSPNFLHDIAIWRNITSINMQWIKFYRRSCILGHDSWNFMFPVKLRVTSPAVQIKIEYILSWRYINYSNQSICAK